MEEVLIQKMDEWELLWGASGVMPCASLFDGGPLAGIHSWRRRRRSARGLIRRARIPEPGRGQGASQPKRSSTESAACRPRAKNSFYNFNCFKKSKEYFVTRENYGKF